GGGGAVVQVVDVRGGDGSRGPGSGVGRDREVAGVGRGAANERRAPAVPAPAQGGVAAERLRRGQRLGIEPRPQAGERVAECGDAAFGGHARTGEEDGTQRGGSLQCRCPGAWTPARPVSGSGGRGGRCRSEERRGGEEGR